MLEKTKEKKIVLLAHIKCGQIETKIDYVSKQIAALSDKFDKYDVVVDEKIAKAIETHEKEYHNQGK